MIKDIDFGFILSMFFRDRLVHVFGNGMFFRFNAISALKMNPKTSAAGLAASSLPTRCSCTLVSLTNVRPTSVISRVRV